MQYNALRGRFKAGLWQRAMEPLLYDPGPMKELKKCRECSQSFTPYYENDYLCNKCFCLEDNSPWEDDNEMVSVPPKSEWGKISIEIGKQADGKRKKN